MTKNQQENSKLRRSARIQHKFVASMTISTGDSIEIQDNSKASNDNEESDFGSQNSHDVDVTIQQFFSASMQSDKKQSKAGDGSLQRQTTEQTVEKRKKDIKKAQKDDQVLKKKRKIKEIAKEDKDASIDETTRMIKIRNSPRIFGEMISILSEHQKQWVVRSGFASLLNFSLKSIPQKLGYDLVQSFDPASCTMRLPNGTINIVPDDVFDIFGMPIGRKDVKLVTTEEKIERLNAWKKQFPDINEVWLIKATDVIEVMKNKQEVDELFKMNFMIILVNVFIESLTNPYVNRNILNLDGEFDECAKFNWCKYLIESLIKSKLKWQKNPTRTFFTGPLLFLIYLYVDRVTYMANRLVNRKFPTYMGWTEELLKKRQNEDFGKGTISTVMRENAMLPAAPKNDLENMEEGWLKTLKMKAKALKHAKAEYDKALSFAKAMSTDIEISKVERKVAKLYGGQVYEDETMNTVNKVISMECNANKTDDMNMDFTEVQPHEEQIEGDKEQIEGGQAESIDSYLDGEAVDIYEQPQVLEHVEWLEFLHTSEGKKVLEVDDSVPSFSLGIENEDTGLSIPLKTKVLEDNESNHNKKEELVLHESTCLNPKAAVEEKKAKREIKVGPSRKSPYIIRSVVIKDNYTIQEYAVWRWFLQKDMSSNDTVFENENMKCTMEDMKSIVPGKQLMSSVIDTWTFVLNYRENYKSDYSPLRFFCTIDTAHGTLDKLDGRTAEARRKSFFTNMNHLFKVYPKLKPNNIELIFFPIATGDHYYLVCYNLKNPCYEVIDNISGYSKSYYKNNISSLHKNFISYLMEMKYTKLAQELKKLDPFYVDMPWQTRENCTDCGIFLMRHMQTYMGDRRNWDCELKPESSGAQQEQIHRLRIKSCHRMLTSELNKHKDVIIKEGSELYQQIDKTDMQTMMKRTALI